MVNIPDKLISQSSRAADYLCHGRKVFLGTIIVTFVDVVAGNSMKTYGGELRENVPCLNINKY